MKIGYGQTKSCHLDERHHSISNMQEGQVKDHATNVRRWAIMPGSVLSQRKAKEKEKAKEKRKEDGSHRRGVRAGERRGNQGKE